MRSLIFTMLLGLCACASADALYRPSVSGMDGPTVVFESGLGDGAETWRGVRAALPNELAVFTWSRAGYDGGGLWASDEDGVRTGAEVAEHLRQNLAQAGARPPYILVSHSIGASYALSYAKAHPDEIAGLVFVDPRLPGFTARCKAEGLRLCEIPALLLMAMPPAARAEIRGFEETESGLTDLAVLRDVPVTILTAGRGAVGEDPNMRALWRSYAEDFARRFTDARHIAVPRSGHYIHHDDPQGVIREIEAMARGPR